MALALKPSIPNGVVSSNLTPSAIMHNLAERQLCTNCGMCCDGSLFATCYVHPTEAQFIKHVIPIKEGNILQQPCAALVDNKCQVYNDRPGGCRHFECDILIAYKESNITKAVALSMIEDTKKQDKGTIMARLIGPKNPWWQTHLNRKY